MRDIEKILNIYLSDFNSYKNYKTYMEPDHILNDDDIEASIKKTCDIYKDGLPDIVLSVDEENELVRRIKATYQIFQSEGSVILGDYEHDKDWYKKLLDDPNYDQYYWNRYKNYLLTTKHFPSGVLDTLENDTLYNLMSYIGNPNDNESFFSIRGLVVGDVQSGKTSNYIGLLTKAADAGYKVIFVLTGTIESLRRQTQERIEEGFVGFDTVNGMDVGVGRGADRLPRMYTSRDKDFTGKDDQNTMSKIGSNSEPMIYVLKKNVSVLKKVYSTLKKINTRFNEEKIDSPLLIIDDEADNASINTNDANNDPTKINGYIRKILQLFTRTSYVGFTATPFANVFISYDSEDEMLKDDLFPRDFIYALHAPSNYCGSRKYFFDDNPNVRIIDDDDQDIFPMRHKKDYEVYKLYPSVYHALNTFLISNAIRDTYDVSKKTHRSMLINMSRFTDVQLKMVDIVEEYIKTIKRHVKLSYKMPYNQLMLDKYILELKNSFDKEYSGQFFQYKKIEWNEIVHNLFDAIKDIQVVAVNSSKRSMKLNYDDYKNNGLRVIAIGGLALSRGLTLEGLTVSYFYRNTATFDVLMQMGRWFGYRDGYDSLVKIFVTDKARRNYRYICSSIEKLKNDIDIMGKAHKKPEEYGIRVKNDSDDLQITARNKMRDTSQKIDRKEFYGNFFETPYLYSDVKINECNIDSTVEFLKQISPEKRDYDAGHRYFRDIDKSLVLDLLSKLNVHPANAEFDTYQLMRFLSRDDKETRLFDVLVMSGLSEKYINIDECGIHQGMVTRKFDIRVSDEVVRISAKRAHLIGRADAKIGLDKKLLDKIEMLNPKAQDYMPEGRNPLLAIYFIDLNNDGNANGIEDEDKCEKFLESLNSSKYNYLVGHCLFFPKNRNIPDDVEFYTVPNKQSYYDKIHEEDSRLIDWEDDGDE